jgi:hypothetical protein
VQIPTHLSATFGEGSGKQQSQFFVYGTICHSVTDADRKNTGDHCSSPAVYRKSSLIF